MSAYPPPIENVPIFDSGLFYETSTGTLTTAELDKSYLKYPISQGSESIAGSLSVSSNVAATGSLTTGANILLNGGSGVNYIQFPDGTQQFTAQSGGVELVNTYTTSGAITPTLTRTFNIIPTTLTTGMVYLYYSIAFNAVAGTGINMEVDILDSGSNVVSQGFCYSVTPTGAVTTGIANGSVALYIPSALNTIRLTSSSEMTDFTSFRAQVIKYS